MKIIITGANFGNKGAQSMLFTTIATLRQNYPDAEIFFAHGAKSPQLNENFLFEEIFYRDALFQIDEKTSKISAAKTPWGSPEETFQHIRRADLIVDVSGFAIGSKWGAKTSLLYLNKIKLAKALGVPIILMPQSFGAFEFGDSQEILDTAIGNTLTYPEKIFAREVDGFLPLRDKYGLKNVSLHADIVLSSPSINPATIYKSAPEISVPKVLPAACVGIVPNFRSFDRPGVNPWRTLQTYYELINFLLKRGKLVYLFRHSAEDISPCTWLKSLFAEDGRVILWRNDFSCFEYDAACRQFEFLIVGRFHGIIHAYRNNVPCLLMGWAVKYRELAQLMYQSRYIFDLAAPNLDVREIFSAIRDMEENLSLNKKILRERLAQIQAGNSCFDAVKKILGRRSS